MKRLLPGQAAGRVFFAGEACSLEAYGTVHGAALTGATTAEAIAQELRGGLPAPVAGRTDPA